MCPEVVSLASAHRSPASWDIEEVTADSASPSSLSTSPVSASCQPPVGTAGSPSSPSPRRRRQLPAGPPYCLVAERSPPAVIQGNSPRRPLLATKSIDQAAAAAAATTAAATAAANIGTTSGGRRLAGDATLPRPRIGRVKPHSSPWEGAVAPWVGLQPRWGRRRPNTPCR